MKRVWMVRCVLILALLLEGCRGPREMLATHAETATRSEETKELRKSRGAPNPARTFIGETAEVPARVTMEFRDTPLHAVLDAIARQVHFPIDFRPGMDEKITVSFHGTPWPEAVETAARMVHASVSRSYGRFFVWKPALMTRVSVDFRQAELTDVANIFARQVDTKVLLDDGLRGKVSIRCEEVPWRRALEEVVGLSGYVLLDDDEAHVIRVVEPATLVARMETRVFDFKHIRPDERYPPWEIPMGYEFFAMDTTCVLLDVFRMMQTRSPGWNSTSATLGTLSYDTEANCIRVVDTGAVLDRMAHVIGQMDVERGR